MLPGSILAQLIHDRQTPTAVSQPLSFGVYYKHTLVALCHALEDCVLLPQSAPPVMITAFQQGKWYLQEADRYGEIADQAEQIVIMAAPDSGFHDHPTSQRANVALVDLATTDPVAQEWHLIILSPDYAAMVLCQELTPEEYQAEGVPTVDHARKFYGLWTFEPNLVLETMQLAIAHIGTYDPALQAQLTQQIAAIAAQMPTNRPQSPFDMGGVASQVVSYLQNSRQDLGQLSLPTPMPALDHNLTSNELQAFLRLSQLVDLADPVNPGAVSEVTALAEMMGQLIDLPAWQLKRLRLAGLLHRLAPATPLELPTAAGPTCALVHGAQVLRTMPQLRAVAQIITHQTEWWNGSGQPAQLAGDAIPLESRILGLIATFQQMVAQFHYDAGADGDLDAGVEAALAACQAQSGDRWDPKLVELLELLVQGIRQGLSLPSIPPKFTAGAGLLDPEPVT